ncbi:hypothetical protein ScPMuIL_014763 [Solemya velum]
MSLRTAFRAKIRSPEDNFALEPPVCHVSAYVTGGLRQCYKHLISNTVQPLHDYGAFTDTEGRFCPKGECILALRYRVLNVIDSQGQTAVVVKAQDTFRGNSVVAVKVLHSNFYTLGTQEGHMLWWLAHADPQNLSNSLRLLNTFTFDDHFCMVFECLLPPPLTVIFGDLPREHLIPKIRKVALRLLAILGFLHQQNVLHADIKPENMLLQSANDFGSVKLVDFGNAIHCVHREVSMYYEDFELQTLLYRAPEVIFGQPFGMEIDMWSLGCVLIELYLGRPLFIGNNRQSICTNMTKLMGKFPTQIFRRGKYFDQLRDFTDNAKQADVSCVIQKVLKSQDFMFANFLAGILRYDPDERLTPVQAACHPFIARELPLCYLLPSSEKGNMTYPGVNVTEDCYKHRPFVAQHIQKKYPTSLDLLHLGTSTNSFEQEGKLESIALDKVAKVCPVPRESVKKTTSTQSITCVNNRHMLSPCSINTGLSSRNDRQSNKANYKQLFAEKYISISRQNSDGKQEKYQNETEISHTSIEAADIGSTLTANKIPFEHELRHCHPAQRNFRPVENICTNREINSSGQSRTFGYERKHSKYSVKGRQKLETNDKQKTHKFKCEQEESSHSLQQSPNDISVVKESCAGINLKFDSKTRKRKVLGSGNHSTEYNEDQADKTSSDSERCMESKKDGLTDKLSLETLMKAIHQEQELVENDMSRQSENLIARNHGSRKRKRRKDQSLLVNNICKTEVKDEKLSSPLSKIDTTFIIKKDTGNKVDNKCSTAASDNSNVPTCNIREFDYRGSDPVGIVKNSDSESCSHNKSHQEWPKRYQRCKSKFDIDSSSPEPIEEWETPYLSPLKSGRNYKRREIEINSETDIAIISPLHNDVHSLNKESCRSDTVMSERRNSQIWKNRDFCSIDSSCGNIAKRIDKIRTSHHRHRSRKKLCFGKPTCGGRCGEKFRADNNKIRKNKPMVKPVGSDPYDFIVTPVKCYIEKPCLVKKKLDTATLKSAKFKTAKRNPSSNRKKLGNTTKTPAMEYADNYDSGIPTSRNLTSNILKGETFVVDLSDSENSPKKSEIIYNQGVFYDSEPFEDMLPSPMSSPSSLHSGPSSSYYSFTEGSSQKIRQFSSDQREVIQESQVPVDIDDDEVMLLPLY